MAMKLGLKKPKNAEKEILIIELKRLTNDF